MFLTIIVLGILLLLVGRTGVRTSIEFLLRGAVIFFLGMVLLYMFSNYGDSLLHHITTVFSEMVSMMKA